MNVWSTRIMVGAVAAALAAFSETSPEHTAWGAFASMG
jgi:hypothetical protein